MDKKWHLCLLKKCKWWKQKKKKSNNKRTTGEWNLKSIPWNTRWDTSWPGGDLWGCAEGILAAVKSIDGWPRSRWDWWRTKGRRGVKRSSERRRRIHGRSWCCAPNCRRAVRGRGCRGSWPALRCWAARKTWLKWIEMDAPTRASARQKAGVSFTPAFWNPGIIYRGWYWQRNGVGTDVTNNVQRLLECMIHAQHFIPSLGLVGRLLHEAVLITRWVEIGGQLRVDEILYLEIFTRTFGGNMKKKIILQQHTIRFIQMPSLSVNA